MILQGNSLDVLRTLGSGSVQTCITSPPYWGLRDYGIDGQLGCESTPHEYVQNLADIFDEVWRVLKEDGTLWLNLGDSYASVHTGGKKSTKSSVGANHEGAQEIKQSKARPASYGLKDKDIVGIPWLVAFELQRRGWYLRTDIIWEKTNAMPESVRDRPTRSHEYVFLLTKAKRYKFNDVREQAVTGGTRKRRTVWSLPTANIKEAHFAAYPIELASRCIEMGSDAGDVVLDPFLGSGTTAIASEKLTRQWIGVELNPDYTTIAEQRISDAKSTQMEAE